MVDANARRTTAGTRVFKKTSIDGKLTTYLGKRDFLDKGTHVDPIEGMVLIDEEYIRQNRIVLVQLNSAFRYGREDLDVLGLTFRKDLIKQSFQVYPPIPEDERPLTRLQERLSRKLGANAYPFWFEIPPYSASSVTLQPASGDTGKPCGVDYELRTVVGDGSNADRPRKHSVVKLAIRKLTYSPAVDGPQPMIDVTKEFLMSPGLLHLEASLDKEKYYHGENIAVNVHIQNNSNRTVKKIKVSVVQTAEICIFTTASYSCDVDKLESSSEGFPVVPGGTLSKTFYVCPLLSKNKEKRGLALNGQLKHEDTDLASSTTLSPSLMNGNGRDPKEAKEILGILVTYRVKIRLILNNALSGEIVAELPFTLTHPKPAEEEDVPSENHDPDVDVIVNDIVNLDDPVELNLNQLDDSPDRNEDDDIIFEDFARSRIQQQANGHTSNGNNSGVETDALFNGSGTPTSSARFPSSLQ